MAVPTYIPLPLKTDLIAHLDSDFDRELEWTEDGDAVTLAGATSSFAVRRYPDADAVAEWTSAAGRITLTDNKIRLTVPLATLQADLPRGAYRYYWSATLSDGRVGLIATGTLTAK